MFEAKFSSINVKRNGTVDIIVRTYDTIEKISAVKEIDGKDVNKTTYVRTLIEELKYSTTGDTSKIIGELKLKMEDKISKDKLKYKVEDIYVALPTISSI